jgi:hypothetical protein
LVSNAFEKGLLKKESTQIVKRGSAAVIAGAALAVGIALVTSLGPLQHSLAAPPAHGLAAPPDVSPAAAAALENKIESLSKPAKGASNPWHPVTITEGEANSYLKYRGAGVIPPGVHDPQVHIGAQLISGTADVDFDELNRQTAAPAGTNDWASRAMSSIFAGRQRVTAAGKLQSAHGQACLVLDSVSIGDTAVPPVLVSWVLAHYVESRYGVDLSKPFSLPEHVTRVELSPTRATLFRAAEANR